MSDKKNLKQQNRSILDKLEEMVTKINERFDKNKREHQELTAVVNALVSVVGPDAVRQAMVEEREQQLQAQNARQKAARDHMIEKKILVPAETLDGELGFVVGTERLPLQNGEFVDRPIQFEMAAVMPEYRASYIGKKVGDKVTVNDVVLTIEAVYRVDRDQAKKVIEQEEAEEKAKAAMQPAAQLSESVPEVVESTPQTSEYKKGETPLVDENGVTLAQKMLGMAQVQSTESAATEPTKE